MFFMVGHAVTSATLVFIVFQPPGEEAKLDPNQKLNKLA